MHELLILSPSKLLIYSLNYALIHFVFKLSKRLVKKYFIKSKHDLAVWVHHLDHARQRGHAAETVEQCQDGLCTAIA